MELRNMFNNVFSPKKKIEENKTTQFKMLDSYDNYFVPIKNIENDASVRCCVDTIARQCAKLQIHHIRRINNDENITVNDNLNYLLEHRPNEYMSTYDFLYNIVSKLYLENNVFIKIKTDELGNIKGLYPLSYNQLELREYNNSLYIKFTFSEGQQETIDYNELIHLRRHYNQHDILGASNDVLKNTLGVYNSVKQGLESAVKNSTKLRGLIKLQNIVRPDDRQKLLDDFNQRFLSLENGAGTAILDSSADYEQLSGEQKTIDAESMQFVQNEIYSYFGVNKKIIDGTANSSEYNSFYESTILPLAIQLSDEFTSKIFTEREKQFQNEVQFIFDKNEYYSLQDKINLVKNLQQAGILSVNECRNIIGLEPREGMDDIIQVSLNNVQLQDQSAYQVGTHSTAIGAGSGAISTNDETIEGDNNENK